MLSPATEKLALVATLGQGADDSCAPRLGMPTVLLEHESDVLPDELRARATARVGGAREQPSDLRVERNRRGLLPR